MSSRFELINGTNPVEQGGEKLGFSGVVANMSRRLVGLPIVATDFKGEEQLRPVQITRPMLNMVGNRYGSNIPSNPRQPTQEELIAYNRRKIPFPLDNTLDAQFEYPNK